jgi:hypothetical protein
VVVTEVESSPAASLPQAHTPQAETVVDASPTASYATDLGTGFVQWLRQGLASHRIIINDTKALVHTVSGTAMLVTLGIFKRFVQEFPVIEAQAKAKKINAYQLVQRTFEKQKLHQ